MTGETLVSKVRAPNPGPLPRVPPTTRSIRIPLAKEAVDEDKEKEKVEEVCTAEEEEEERKVVSLVKSTRYSLRE